MLYNIAAGTSTLESQAGVYLGNSPYASGYSRGTLEYTGAPAAVNNNGIMFGSSGAGSTVTTGEPTVWQNGAAAGMVLPSGSVGGQIYAANDLNIAVGSTKGTSAGADIATAFFYNSTTPSASYAAVLPSLLGSNVTFNDPHGINDANVIVGMGTNSSSGYVSGTNISAAAIDVPIIYNASSGTAWVMPNSSSAFLGGIPFAISNSGLVTGTEQFTSGSGQIFLYNIASGVTTSIAPPPGAGSAEGRGINDSGEIVGYGGGLYAVPFLYDGTSTYDLQTLLVNNQSGSWNLDHNTSSAAFGIADNGDIVGLGMYNGSLTAFLMVPTGTVTASPQYLTFNNTGGTGDGVTWDTTSQNWNNGTSITTFSSTNGDYVSFTDANNGHYNLSIPATVTPGSVTFNNSAGNYTVSGTGGIGGSGVFFKYGTGTVTISTVNTYTGPTNVDGGKIIYSVKGALPAGTILDVFGTGSSVVLASVGTAYAQQLQYVGIDTGDTLDVTNNDLDFSSGYIYQVNHELAEGYNGGGWNGTTGIISSSAGPSHPLMALGAIINDNGSGAPLFGSGGTIASTFGGVSPSDGDILVKFTYYGDANLSGVVDGSDYSRVDAAYAADQAYVASNPTGTAIPDTGWYNGDFNYDGVVNGSDYTLMDNAFNTQDAAITAELASTTAQVASAGTSVPEPGALTLLGMAIAGLLGRRRLRDRASIF